MTLEASSSLSPTSTTLTTPTSTTASTSKYFSRKYWPTISILNNTGCKLLFRLTQLLNGQLFTVIFKIQKKMLEMRFLGMNSIRLMANDEALNEGMMCTEMRIAYYGKVSIVLPNLPIQGQHLLPIVRVFCWTLFDLAFKPHWSGEDTLEISSPKTHNLILRSYSLFSKQCRINGCLGGERRIGKLSRVNSRIWTQATQGTCPLRATTAAIKYLITFGNYLQIILYTNQVCLPQDCAY